jgi:hypothetical protein
MGPKEQVGGFHLDGGDWLLCRRNEDGWRRLEGLGIGKNPINGFYFLGRAKR